jgi:hypothetical protein
MLQTGYAYNMDASRLGGDSVEEGRGFGTATVATQQAGMIVKRCLGRC